MSSFRYTTWRGGFGRGAKPPSEVLGARGLGDGGAQDQAERNRGEHGDGDREERRRHPDRVAEDAVEGRRARRGADGERVVEAVGARAAVRGHEGGDGGGGGRRRPGPR